MTGKTMLDTITKDYALWYVKSLKEKITWYEENNFCVHGHSKNVYSLDMERDCFACEMGEERDVYREALSSAKYDSKVRALGLLKVMLDAEVPPRDVIAYISKHF